MSGPPHILLTLSRELWCELLFASLPLRLAGQRFDMNRDLRWWARRLVSGGAWRAAAGRALDGLVHVQGDWSIDLERLGTELRCARQELAGSAAVSLRLCATIELARGRLEVPLVVEQRLQASVRLTDVRYEPRYRAVVGELAQLRIDTGRGAAAALGARFAEQVLTAQIRRVHPVVLLRRDRVEEIVVPLGGPLRMQLGVEDLDLDIDENEVRLLIRFGFHTDALCDDVPDRS